MSILYVGVDVSKNYLDVALCLKQDPFSLGKYANDEAGLTKLTQDVTQANQKHECDFIHLVVEPTGGYQLPLVILAFEQGWQVSLPNPKQVRGWAKGQGVRAKNDTLDSRVLAKFGAKSGVRAKSGPLRQFYDRLRGREKPYRLTVVAVARKILVWAFAIFTRRVPFDPSLHLPNSA